MCCEKVVLVADTDHQSIHAMADFEGSQNLRVGIYSFAVDTNYSVAVEIVFGLVAVGHFDVARMNKVCGVALLILENSLPLWAL